MKSSIVALTALVAGAFAASNASSVYYLTTTVTALTTYCPGPTVLTHGSLTSTITEATTVTITDCPCTAVIPVTISTSVACVTCAVPTTLAISNSSTIISSFQNGTAVSTPKIASSQTRGSSSPTTAVVATPVETTVSFTGAANVRAVAASGAGLAGFLGFVAYIL